LLCSTNIKNAQFFTTIDAIPSEYWNVLDCTKNRYFHPKFLKAIEENHPEIQFFYTIIFDDLDKPKSIATIQVIDVHLDAISSNMQTMKKIARKLHIFPKSKPLQLLICGNIFVSGEHGLFIRHNRNKQTTIKEVAKAILQFVKTQPNLKIDAFLFKDFVNESLHITEKLKDFNYHRFSVEPNMMLHLDSNWKSFDDYLQAMKTKFRVKARKALKLSKELKIIEVTSENIDAFLPKMIELYSKVATNAEFNLHDFNLNTYRTLVADFSELYILKTYWLQDKIVGFSSALKNGNTLDAHFVGIDYQLNKQYAVYQRMLYDYIDLAISEKFSAINFGRTASEIKSSVGAKPQDLTMYLRHKNSLPNKILKLFLQHVQPTPFHQKYPFKELPN